MKFIFTSALIHLPFFAFSQSILSYQQSSNGRQAAYAYVPFGLNIYPFEQKNFGFQIEFSAGFPFGEP
jgi:hypothetical protein